MSGKIYYLGLYSGDAAHLKRQNIRMNPAGTAKMDYILYALKAIGKHVTLLSVVGSKDTGFCRQEVIAVDEHERHIYLPTLVIRIFGKNIVRGDLIRFFLKRYFLQHIRREDTVIVYHSLIYKNTLAKLRKKIGFRMILEVEEIYQDVVACSALERAMEYSVLEEADAYILSTEKLNKKINKQGCPSVTANGSYRASFKRDVSFPDEKCHCVYSGTLDRTKGGAAVAVAVAEFLPSNYHIHILGFGTDAEKQYLLRQIGEIQKKTKCSVSYDGLLTGEEFICFLQKCHVGFSTQLLAGDYTDTSFPSKVLTYLANGLRVVSSRIPGLEQSKVGGMIYYYDTSSPKEIAKVIQEIDWNAPYDSRAALESLDRSFQDKLSMMLREIEC